METLMLPFTPRFVILTICCVVTVLLFGIGIFDHKAFAVVLLPLVVFGALSALGFRDLMQTRHAVLRNYPISAHMRFLLEEIRPELRQYFFESEKDGRPFSRDIRALVYQRAKMDLDKRPFGTQNDVYQEGRYNRSDQRAGDTLDLSLFKVARRDGPIDYICLHAGERVRALHDVVMWGRSLQSCLDAGMAAAVMPIWHACVTTRLPVYSIMAVSDAQGCPVTIEQIVLPYRRGAATPDFVVASLHAWSTEGRFGSQGLLCSKDRTPSHWAAVIDPTVAVVTAEMHDGVVGPEGRIREDHAACAVI